MTMKNIVLFLLTFLGFNFVLGQTHRFIYEFKYKTDSLATDYKKDNMNLDVNPDEVKFYPYFYAETDSLNKIRDSKSAVWDDLPALVRKKNSHSNTNYYYIDSFYSLKSEDPMTWKLHNETKQVEGYQLQKATTSFGGRKWTAWFAKDINIQEGPYKFCGLPGLIFSVEDQQQNFIFSLVKSYKLNSTYDTSTILEKFTGQTPIPITYKILQKKRLEDYNDPLRDMRNSFKENTNPENTFWVGGVKITSLDQFKELTEKQQEKLRKENNPIERDKMIHYPVK